MEVWNDFQTICWSNFLFFLGKYSSGQGVLSRAFLWLLWIKDEEKEVWGRTSSCSVHQVNWPSILLQQLFSCNNFKKFNYFGNLNFGWRQLMLMLSAHTRSTGPLAIHPVALTLIVATTLILATTLPASTISRNSATLETYSAARSTFMIKRKYVYTEEKISDDIRNTIHLR